MSQMQPRRSLTALSKQKIKNARPQSQQNPNFFVFDPYAQDLNDQFGESPLIVAMKQNNKFKFLQLYPKLQTTSRVNSFMAQVFLNGAQWHYSMKQPQFAMDRDSSGKTLLHYAVAGNINLAEGYFKNQIIQRCAGVQDSRGTTSLMLAAALGHDKCVQVLRDIEVGIQDMDGCTALMYAAKFGRKRCIELLLREEFLIKDKRNFIFIDYLPKDFDSKYLTKLNSLLTGLFKNYQPNQKYNDEKKDSLINLPQYTQIYVQFRDQLIQTQTDILSRIDEGEKLQTEVIVDPLIRLDFIFNEYLKTNCFPGFSLQIVDFIDQYNNILNQHIQINKQFASQLIHEIQQFVQQLFDSLYSWKSKLLQLYKLNIDKIHLVLLYKQNDLHEDFDIIFKKLQNQETEMNKQLQNCIKLFNQLAFEDLNFTKKKEECIKITYDFQQFGDILYEDLKNKFQSSLDLQHEALNTKTNCMVENILNIYKMEIQGQIDKLTKDIQDKMMLKIDESVLIKLNQSIKKQDAFAISSIVDIPQIKNHLNCLKVMFQNTQKIIPYNMYICIYNTAQQFITKEDGLLQFISQHNILPILGVIPSFLFVEDYFKVYHQQYQFSVQQFIQGMINELVSQWSPQVEKSFILCLQKYFIQNRPDNVPKISSNRYGTLKKQKINIMDSLLENIELTFSYFYLSIIGQICKCELVFYEKINNIKANELTDDDQYVGTYKIFQPIRGKTYNCIAPGWMYMDQRNNIDILVEPLFECINDI
ncbi:Ankyrin repeat-containing protein [Spironucleus salmonicida]|uniref:Ankyrin repeat-containing protein n=1 Tax=Spironucleus salmonicida TaxID=348837 RepID=V6LLB8_9EUKA|nr:Ankyrin repeat-containing protein [Spironucleus salmonicida]|eukprot:EST45153.1 Ankyrin repeat-containing protein [Spironucleus salmonicida]